MYFNILLLFCLAISSIDCCSMVFKDPCLINSCPDGTTCKARMDYYCDDRFGGICTSVATCVSPATKDPCDGYKCDEGTKCVNVTDQCSNNGTLCSMKAQCNAVNRTGKCPDSKMLAVHSCMNSCSKDKLDHMCPRNTKCCYSEMALGNYCVNVDGAVATTVAYSNDLPLSTTPANMASSGTFSSNITGIFLSQARPALRTSNTFKIQQMNMAQKKTQN